MVGIKQITYKYVSRYYQILFGDIYGRINTKLRKDYNKIESEYLSQGINLEFRPDLVLDIYQNMKNEIRKSPYSAKMTDKDIFVLLKKRVLCNTCSIDSL